MMTLTHMRYPYCHGKNVEAQRTYTIQCGEPRTLYHCAPCARSFSETRHTPIAQLKTPIALVVQVLAALTEGVGINAATRLYGLSNNRIYRWQERLRGVKKRAECLPGPLRVCHRGVQGRSCPRGATSQEPQTRHQEGPVC